MIEVKLHLRNGEDSYESIGYLPSVPRIGETVTLLNKEKFVVTEVIYKVGLSTVSLRIEKIQETL